MKKAGKKIKQSGCVIPGLVKRPTFEFSILASLVALEHNRFKDDHGAHLWVLADMCSKFESEKHVKTHSETLKRIVSDIHQANYLNSARWYPETRASVDILLDFIKRQSNLEILTNAQNEIKKLCSV